MNPIFYSLKPLEKIENFNRLLFVFHFSDFMEGTSRLIQFARLQSDQFLKTNDLKQLKSFLELMANYEDITPIIENNVRQLDGKILNAIDKKSISRFIRLVHKISHNVHFIS